MALRNLLGGSAVGRWDTSRSGPLSVMCSDGITEAETPSGECIGTDGLLGPVGALAHLISKRGSILVSSSG